MNERAPHYGTRVRRWYLHHISSHDGHHRTEQLQVGIKAERVGQLGVWIDPVHQPFKGRVHELRGVD